ncbi:MAG TPA: hypothetical protein VFA48_06235 [Gammaproteobacteria bacterium]|nr:hypothetical protein [Gammaproteobacteria bacterium]
MTRAKITIDVEYESADRGKVREQVIDAVENLKGQIGHGVLTAPSHELVIDVWSIDWQVEAKR